MDDFDRWTTIKRRIDARILTQGFHPKENEVWMCNLGKNVGYEQSGRGQKFVRPVLLLKKFNRQMFWAVPLSTKQKPIYFYHNFTTPNGNKGSAILAQLRLISSKRLTRKYFDMSTKDVDIIKTKLIDLIKKNPHQ